MAIKRTSAAVSQLLQLPQRPIVGRITRCPVGGLGRQQPGGHVGVVLKPQGSSKPGSVLHSIPLWQLNNHKAARDLVKSCEPSTLEVAKIEAPGNAVPTAYLVQGSTKDEAIWKMHHASPIFNRAHSSTSQALSYQWHGVRDPSVSQVPQGPNYRGSTLAGDARKLAKFLFRQDDGHGDGDE